MFIELVDVLRCPEPHEDTWLVLATERMAHRDVMEGLLGCPICQAEYRIDEGIVRFERDVPETSGSPLQDVEAAIRLAALLDLSDERGFAVLAGRHGYLARALRELVDVQLLLVNPPAGVPMGDGLSGLTSRAGMPLAAGSARAVALDAPVTTSTIDAAVNALAPGGRLIAPLSVPVPAGVTELARDDRHWVAARELTPQPSGMIVLERRR